MKHASPCGQAAELIRPNGQIIRLDGALDSGPAAASYTIRSGWRQDRDAARLQERRRGRRAADIRFRGSYIDRET